MLATEDKCCGKVGWREDSVDEIREEMVAGGSGKIKGIEDRSFLRRVRRDTKKDGRNVANVWRDTWSSYRRCHLAVAEWVRRRDGFLDSDARVIVERV